MGSFKTFKDILEEAKIKEEMDSLTPSSSENVTIFEKNKGAKSFKDPAPKTTLASPVEAEKLRADIYEAKQAADKDAFRAKQAADYEAKIAKEEAKKAKEVAKEANARLKAEQALEKATVSNAKKAQTLNLKNIDIADDIKTTEDALSKANIISL